MDPRHLDELIEIERGYWWHVAKRALVVELLARFAERGARVVEGGFGGPANLLALKERGYDVAGLDVLEAAVEQARAHGIVDARVHDLERPWPFERGSARAVLLLDVLEHMDAPEKVLAHAAHVLEDGGRIVATVPACPFLMGPWDRLLGHRRRYTTSSFRALAREAGLRVLWLSHWNAFSLPPALVLRTLERMAGGRKGGVEFPRVPPWLNALLVAFASAERRWMRHAPVPWGVSLAGVLAR